MEIFSERSLSAHSLKFEAQQASVGLLSVPDCSLLNKVSTEEHLSIFSQVEVDFFLMHYNLVRERMEQNN